MEVTPRRLRLGMNLWPPFRFSGIKVVDISDDWTRAEVRLRVGRLTSNYVGTAFGGSLFAMGDPFHMLLALHQLGRDYIVWDSAAEIEFVSPGKGTVTAIVDMPVEVVDELRAAAADGKAVRRWFDLDLVGEDGQLVARLRRQLYVRRKPSAAAAGSPGGHGRR